MIEILVYTLLILLVVTLASNTTMLAATLLTMVNYSSLIATNSLFVQLLACLLYPTISGINIITSLLLNIEGGNWWLLIIFVMIAIFMLFSYCWFLSNKGKKILESRRFNKSIEAMKIVFCIVLLFASFSLLEISLGSYAFVSISIFALSFFAMYKLRINLLVCMLILSVIYTIVSVF